MDLPLWKYSLRSRLQYFIATLTLTLADLQKQQKVVLCWNNASGVPSTDYDGHGHSVDSNEKRTLVYIWVRRSKRYMNEKEERAQREKNCKHLHRWHDTQRKYWYWVDWKRFSVLYTRIRHSSFQYVVSACLLVALLQLIIWEEKPDSDSNSIVLN